MDNELYEDIYWKGFKVKVVSKTTDNRVLLEVVESSLQNIKVGTNYLIHNNSFEKLYKPCKKTFKIQKVVGVFQYTPRPGGAPYCIFISPNHNWEVGKTIGLDKCLAIIPIEKEIEL